MDDRRIHKLRAAALAGTLILLGSGCQSVSGSTPSASPTVQTATPTTAGGDSIPADALCHALITAQDLPPDFGSSSTASPCGDNPKLQASGFKGRNGGLEMINEEIERADSDEAAASRLPQLVTELNLLAHNPSEQDPAPFGDLGDEVHYFTQQHEQTYWNTLYIRRGKLLIYLSVTKYGPFTPADMHLLASKAVQRTASLP
ncbi:hypothetical protein ACFVH7_36875 [Kitasatospora indigofera]|uniref:hypothetical protein n=1 Tax=Kitasatospora indigofera TaxID=67307 RepID=UPI00363C53CB